MLKVIAIDDEPVALEVIRSLSLKIAFIELVSVFTDAFKASDFLQKEKIDQYLEVFRGAISTRLQRIYDGFMDLKKEGYAVDAIAPQAAIYLTIKIALTGKTTKEGKLLKK